jgi:hypothetical protein
VTAASKYNPQLIVGVTKARDGGLMSDDEKLRAGKTTCTDCDTYMAADQLREGEVLCSRCMRDEPFGLNSRRKSAHGGGYYNRP